VSNLTIYQEFIRVVKEKGEKIGEMPLPLSGRRSSAWKVGKMIIVLDENSPYPQGRVISVIERKKFVYLSPFAVRAGALQMLGIADREICSEKRIKEILKRLVRT